MNDKERKERASLFFPFDALKGLQEALREKEKIRVHKKSLSVDTLTELSNKIRQLTKGMMVTIVYYQEQEYIQVTGLLTKIDFTAHTMMIVDKTIKFEDIIEILSEEIAKEDF